MSSKHNSSIPIYLQDCQTTAAGQQAIRAILIEIQQAVKAYDKTGKRYGLDLTALPLSEFDIAKLLKLLGQGEINIRLSTMGESEIYETIIDTVWVIKHKNENDKVTTILIEVGAIPDIVQSEIEDIDEIDDRIQEILDSL